MLTQPRSLSILRAGGDAPEPAAQAGHPACAFPSQPKSNAGRLHLADLLFQRRSRELLCLEIMLGSRPGLPLEPNRMKRKIRKTAELIGCLIEADRGRGIGVVGHLDS